MATAASRVSRNRADRALDTGDADAAKVVIPAPIKEEAKKVYLANQMKNKGDRDEKAARKSLYTLMKEGKLKHFLLTVAGEKNARVNLTVDIGPGRSTYACDVAKLKTLVSEKDFMEIVSATNTAIEAVVGKNIATQVMKEIPGDETVTVKVVK